MFPAENFADDFAGFQIIGEFRGLRARVEKSFSLARLLRGIAVGFGASPREDIADAIYEIAKSLDNSASLFEDIDSTIGRSVEIK